MDSFLQLSEEERSARFSLAERLAMLEPEGRRCLPEDIAGAAQVAASEASWDMLADVPASCLRKATGASG